MIKPNLKNQKNILESYLECALWSSELDNYRNVDVSLNSIKQAEMDIKDFMDKSEHLLTKWTEEQVGHDFWLTRNHHGAGFWDRDLPNKKKLTEIAEAFKGLNCFEVGNGIVIE